MHGSRFSRDHGDLKTPFLAGKERELLESKKWPACFSQSVDITKVQIDAFKPWISRRVTELMGVEDEIVVEYCLSQLKFFGETDAKANAENAGDGGKVLNEKPYLDPKKLQINLTGFMAKNARVFVKELWDLLLAAQDSEHGMPQSFIDEKKRELAANQQRRHERVSSPPPVDPSGTRADLAHDHSGERDTSPKVEHHPRDTSRSRAWYETRKYDNSRRQRYRGTRRAGSYRDRGYTRRRRRSYSSSRSRSSSASYRRTLRRRSVSRTLSSSTSHRSISSRSYSGDRRSPHPRRSYSSHSTSSPHSSRSVYSSRSSYSSIDSRRKRSVSYSRDRRRDDGRRGRRRPRSYSSSDYSRSPSRRRRDRRSRSTDSR